MLTVPEAARRARVSAETVRRWIRAGKLSSQKVGTQHLVEERDVDALAGRSRVAEEPVTYTTQALDEVGVPSLRGRIVVDPRVVVGKPVVRGTRIPVDLVLTLLAQGWSVPELLDNYPSLTDADVRACLAFAATRINEEHVLPMRS